MDNSDNVRLATKRLLGDLPTLNYNVFVYLISFLKEVLSERHYNRFFFLFFLIGFVIINFKILT
jgi:hypothetical protein